MGLVCDPTLRTPTTSMIYAAFAIGWGGYVPSRLSDHSVDAADDKTHSPTFHPSPQTRQDEISLRTDGVVQYGSLVQTPSTWSIQSVILLHLCACLLSPGVVHGVDYDSSVMPCLCVRHGSKSTVMPCAVRSCVLLGRRCRYR
jgi:hypothetical protein